MFYKFLHTKDIDKVVQEGTIIVSSLKYFRDLEDEQKPWIGDRLEGATELTTPQHLTLTEGSSELEMVNRANIGLGMFKKGFAQVSGGGRIEMGGARFVHQVPNMHIYSCCRGDFEELKQLMCLNAAEPYDACLKIEDPTALVKAIMEEGEVEATKAPVGAIFKSAICEKVTYDDVIRDIGVGPVIAPSAFRKGHQFAAQREHRLVFQPAVDALPDRIVIKLPDARKHYHELFRDFRPQVSPER